MKYVIKKRNVVASMTGWVTIVVFGIAELCILLGISMEPTLATGPVVAMFILLLLMVLSGGVLVLYASRPKIVVKGDEIRIYGAFKRKKVASIRKINGRFAAPYTEESSEKQLYHALRGVPGRRLIAKLIASTEKWKKEQMAKLTYYANGVEVMTIHTGMKNAIRLDSEILESLENNWGYTFDGNDIMGVVPVTEKIQVSAANLRHFTDEKEAEKYLKKMIVVEGGTKGATVFFLIGFLVVLVVFGYLKANSINDEITPALLFLFGFMSLIMLLMWWVQGYTKSKSIQLLKARQELVLAADQLYALGGLGKKKDKLKITPNFIFSNSAPGIAPLEEIVWVYVKNSETVNEVCTGLRDGRILTIARYKTDSGAQEAAAYNILCEYMADRKILWGYGPQQQAIYDKFTGRKK